MPFSLTDLNNTQILGDSTPNALHIINYDSNGNAILYNDKAAIVSTTTLGTLISGADFKQSRLIKSSSESVIRAGQDILLFYDGTDTTTIDTNIWLQTLSIMTQTIALTIGRIFNASNATTGGAMNTSTRQFSLTNGSALVYKSRVKMGAHAAHNIFELGFGNPTTSTSSFIGDGAVWRKDGSGQWLPVLSFNGFEIFGVPFSNSTLISLIPLTSYAIFSVTIEQTKAIFKITTSSGILVNEQIIDFSQKIGTYNVGHLKVLERTYNISAIDAPTTSPSLIVARTSVWLLYSKGYTSKQAFVNMGRGSLTSPITYLQNANYIDGSAPASATLSNTAAGYTTLGGQWQFAAVAGAEIDYCLFGYQAPISFSFVCTRISISAYNTGVVNSAATPTVLQWGVAFGSGAVTLASAAPNGARRSLGIHSFPLSSAIGASGGPDVIWEGMEMVYQTYFLQVFVKVPIGAATASQIIRGTCTIEGYFE